MNYLTDSHILTNYSQINENFMDIKNNELKGIEPDYNIFISNDRNSCAKANFIDEYKKYIGKNINIFIIKKNHITHLIGPILINTYQNIISIIEYIVENIPTENIYLKKEEFEKLIENYTNSESNVYCSDKKKNHIYN